MPETYEDVPDFTNDMEEAQQVNNPIAHLSAGTRHNLAVSRSGHLYSWGLGGETIRRCSLSRFKLTLQWTSSSASGSKRRPRCPRSSDPR